ncbi:MAG: histidine kinase [Gammaproteobacteria bacterium]|nr:histidine kinase [Gammaproteobacteria bacterium]
MGGEPVDAFSTGMAETIRLMSSMLARGAGCAELVSAAAKSASTMLPGDRMLVLAMDEKWKTVRVIDTSGKAVHLADKGFTLPTYCDLRGALAKPHRVHQGAYADLGRLFGEPAQNLLAADDLVVYKVMPCNDASSLVLAVVTTPVLAERAEAVLATLGELMAALTAGYDATASLGKSVAHIARAKTEWEQAVDLLPDLVCLVDPQGRVIRVNRTVERWGLGDVSAVRGRNLHDVMHPACSLKLCSLKSALATPVSAQVGKIHHQATATDTILDRTLAIQKRFMLDSRKRVEHESPACAMVVISDISPLHKAQMGLWKLNKTLEERVAERTAELEQANKLLTLEIEQRRAAEAELQASSEDLQSLSEQLLNAQESERRRLSAELHDSIEQSLRAIKYSLERVSAINKDPAIGDADIEVDKVIEQVVDCIRETRSLVTSLRPLILDDMGPASAISWLCRHFADVYRGIEFRAELSVSNTDVPAALATPLYRIIQEGLNNVVKHASAKAVIVTVGIQGDMLKAEVLDDGVGFDVNSADTHKLRHLGNFGRLGMRRRASNSGGVLILDSTLGKGTRLAVEWDLTEVESA